ncbi:MAG: nitroreductase, partial [Candidatus Delongbacteria bacterium]
FLAIDKERLKSLLKTDLEIITVIAVGKPIENVEIVDCKEGDIKYYRDDKGNHFVPKRSLEELIIEKY